MQLNKILTYAAAFVIAMIILLSGALVIMPQVDAAVAAQAETDTVNAENAVKDTEIALLAEEFASIDGLRDELAGLQAAIPSGIDTPILLGQLSDIADAQGVTLDAISVGDPLTAVAVDAVAADAAAPNAVAADADADADADASAPAAAAVVAVPVSLAVSGQSAAVLSFIGGLQASERIITVTAFSTATGAATDAAPVETASVTASVSAVVYGLPSP